MKGKVVAFFPQRGFGFIESPDGGNTFFHISNVEHRRAPHVGDVLAFDLGTDTRTGKPIATDLRKVDDAGDRNDANIHQ